MTTTTSSTGQDNEEFPPIQVGGQVQQVTAVQVLYHVGYGRAPSRNIWLDMKPPQATYVLRMVAEAVEDLQKHPDQPTIARDEEGQISFHLEVQTEENRKLSIAMRIHPELGQGTQTTEKYQEGEVMKGGKVRRIRLTTHFVNEVPDGWEMVPKAYGCLQANYHPAAQVEWELSSKKKTFCDRGWIDLPPVISGIFQDNIVQQIPKFVYTLADYMQPIKKVEEEGQLYVKFRVSLNTMTGTGYQLSDREDQKVQTAHSYQTPHMRAVRMVSIPDLLVQEDGTIPTAVKRRDTRK